MHFLLRRLHRLLRGLHLLHGHAHFLLRPSQFIDVELGPLLCVRKFLDSHFGPLLRLPEVVNHLGELVEVGAVDEFGVRFHEHLGQEVGLVLGKGTNEPAADFGYE